MTDAQSYSTIANDVFAPLYPYYASLIVEKTGVVSGTCLDAGCGCGHLGLALAELTSLKLYLLDKSPEMIRIANENVRSRGMSNRAETLKGNAQAIPLSDASVDLVVSRGSVPFWEDLPQAFREVMRVLKRGGYAYIGGGLGSKEMREKIMCAMRRGDPRWMKGQRSNIPRHSESYYRDSLHAAGIEKFSVTRGETGTWIEFNK